MLKYAPELDLRIRPHLNPTNDSWRVDETYTEVKGDWKYLYRVVDSMGNTRLLYNEVRSRDGKAAAQFLHKVLKAQHTQAPRVITVDKNAAYPVAMETLKVEESIAIEIELRQSKYLNNVIEQDHRNIKRILKPMMGNKSVQHGKTNLERNCSDEYNS